MDNLNDILSSLTDEDMEMLRNAAENLFSSQNEPETEKADSGMPDFSSILGNAKLLSKISTVMNSMNQKSERTRFIEALKPLLSKKRQQRADEALQMMKLFEILPALNRIMDGDDKK